MNGWSIVQWEKYDPTTGVMRIQLLSGKPFAFAGINADQYADFKISSEPISWILKHRP